MDGAGRLGGDPPGSHTGPRGVPGARMGVLQGGELGESGQLRSRGSKEGTAWLWLRGGVGVREGRQARQGCSRSLDLGAREALLDPGRAPGTPRGAGWGLDVSRAETLMS